MIIIALGESVVGRRTLVAGVPAALIPVANHVPALAALAIVAAAMCGLIAFEFVHYAEARERIRHGSERS